MLAHRSGAQRACRPWTGLISYAGESTISTDPYAAPKTHVADVPETRPDGNFNPAGLRWPAGHGWDWIKSARGLTKQQTWTWMGIFILFAIIFILLAIIGGVLGAIPELVTVAVGVAAYSIFIGPILLGGLMLGCDAVYKGQPVSVSHLFAGLGSHSAGKLAGLGLASLLANVVLSLITGSIFGFEQANFSDPEPVTLALAWLVMLGFYMALWFSYPLVVLNDFGVVQALRTSFTGCLKNIVPLLVYGLMLSLLAIAASIPFMLGWLILGPVMFASIYTGYRDIFYQT